MGKMDPVPPMTDAQRRDWFDYYLHCAVFLGEANEAGCVGINRDTWMALERVARERTIEAVKDARTVFEHDLNGWKETLAVRQALETGEIPHDQRDKSVYYPEMVNWGSADVNAAKAWLEANRKNPGEIYREMVLDQS